MINIQWMKMTMIIPTHVEFIKNHVIQGGVSIWGDIANANEKRECAQS